MADPPTGQRGTGLAIAGLSVSGAVLLLAAVVIPVIDFRIWTLPARSDSGDVTRPGQATIQSIRTGDCFTPRGGLPEPGTPPLGDGSVQLIPCDKPHRAEAYASFTLTEGDFPGLDGIAATARPQCARLFMDYALDPMAFGRLQTYYFHPDEQGWATGRRTVVCWVARPGDAELDVSVRGNASELGAAQLEFLAAVKPLNTAGALRPAKSPRQDLAHATAWAGRMAQAQAETIRLLEEADLPNAEAPTGRLVAELEAGLPFWQQAAEAPDADAFLSHLRSVDQHNGEQHLRRIRGLLDLPLPTSEPAQALERTAVSAADRARRVGRERS
ncbi:septum formation family protein [Streptomyces sp. NWU339]|uniref:septum formation family protein n=1 Tax=Streptomyces sp. NWU339 TaxID=2185284 RepID=UPI00215B5BE2|nr:septum formation family protein [Streptomyces sp. NWU339]